MCTRDHFDAPRAGTPTCDTSAIKAPFAPTGWKPVALDHVAIQATGDKREAAYYSALMNWTLRSDDGRQAVLDVGTVGSVVIRGGFQTPPPPPPPTAADSAAGRARGPARAPRKVAWDSFAWVIEPWNAKKVEAELTMRGLTSRDDTGGKGDTHDPAAKYMSYHATTPDGYDLQISNATKANRTVR